MKVMLQNWYDKWLDTMREEGADLLYVQKNARGEPSCSQVHFVRDTLARVVWRGIEYDDLPVGDAPRTDCKATSWVIGEHMSKSVPLPVYMLERPDLGIRFVLRDNFYDWNISVVSETAIVTDLRGFQLDFSDSDKKKFAGRAGDANFLPEKHFTVGDYWDYLFFQGFPDEYKFGPYVMNPRRFSICLGGEYSVYTFLWLIMRDLIARGPL